MNFGFFQETGFNTVLGLCIFEIHSRQNHHSQFFFTVQFSKHNLYL